MNNVKYFFKINKIGTLRSFLFKKIFINKNNGDVSHLTTFKEGVKLGHDLHGVWIAPFDFGGETIIYQNVTVGNRVGKDKIGSSKGFLFIGAGAFIGSDVEIGANVIVGANAIVTKDVPDNSIVLSNNIQSQPKNIDQLIELTKRKFSDYKIYKSSYDSKETISIRRIYSLRTRYDNARTKMELNEIQIEYKLHKKIVKIPLSMRLIWSKFFRIFTFKLIIKER